MTKNPNIPSDNFAAFAFSSADILVEVEQDGVIVFADGAMQGLLGRKSADIIGLNFKQIIAHNHHGRLKNIMETIKQKNRIDSVPLDFIAANGEEMAFRLSGIYIEHDNIQHINSPNDNSKNKCERFYFSLRCESLIQHYEELAEIEQIEGIVEKEIFTLHACKQIVEANARGEELNITIVDIPELQILLDSLSTDNAVKLLKSIGDYIKTKSVNNEAAKIIERGSYSIITPGNTNNQELVDGIKNIAKLQIKGLDLKVEATNIKTSSDEYPLSEHDLANAVLYTINKFAENKGEKFSITSLNESYEEMLDITLDHIGTFKKTLSADAFSLAFQPIVNLRTGIVHHHECLVRLHDMGKFKNPFEFITFGEQAGLINDCDLAITEKVLCIIQERKKMGQHVSLAVNLSGRSLSSNLFIDTFLNLLRKYNDVRSHLMIEVTESFKIDNMQMANDFIQTLRKEGNLVCLDDFGVGESSFNYLRHLQVDFVKIDGSYVRDSMQTERGRKLLKAMASLCRNLDMMMIGEMVETQKEAEFLFESGVQYGQGYYIGKPSTDESILNFHDKITSNYAGLFNVRRFRDEGFGEGGVQDKQAM